MDRLERLGKGGVPDSPFTGGEIWRMCSELPLETFRSMGARIDPDELLRSLAVRGLLQQDLAKIAGLSESGLSRAMRGRPVRPSTYGKIARALAAVPVIELADSDRLLPRRASPRDSAPAGADTSTPTGGRVRDIAAASGPAPETAVVGTSASGHQSKE